MRKILVIGMMGLAGLVGCDQSARNAGTEPVQTEPGQETAPEAPGASSAADATGPVAAAADQLRWTDEIEIPATSPSPAQSVMIPSPRAAAAPQANVPAADSALAAKDSQSLIGTPLAAALQTQIAPADDYIAETGEPIVLPDPAMPEEALRIEKLTAMATASVAASLEQTRPAASPASTPATQAAPAAPKPAPAVAQTGAGSAATATYTVLEGETLWSIAVKYYGNGQKWQEIARANAIDEPSQVAAGRTLIMP